MTRAARSLKVREDCIKKVKSAYTRSDYSTQKDLADDAGLGLATISNFIQGRQVDRMNFQEICFKLNLDWRDVAELSNSEDIGNSINSEQYLSSSNSEIVFVAEIEEQTNEDEASTDSPASLTQPLEQAGVTRQKMMSGIEVTGNLEAKDLIQKAKPGNYVEQEMVTNSKAGNMKFGNLTQES